MAIGLCFLPLWSRAAVPEFGLPLIFMLGIHLWELLLYGWLMGLDDWSEPPHQTLSGLLATPLRRKPMPDRNA